MAHHQRGQFTFCRLLGGHRCHILTLAQHRNAVTQRQHFIQMVGNKEDGVAVVTQAAQLGEELRYLLRRQHGGRLVEDQYIDIAVEQLEDFDLLARRHGNFID